MCFKNT